MVDQNFWNRVAPFLVLEVLKNHTDGVKGVKLTEIVELVEQDYGITMDRKRVARILDDLLELSERTEDPSWKNPMPFSIKCDTVTMGSRSIRENWCAYQKFEDAEIRTLTDMLVAVEGYPTKRLGDKLQQLGSFAVREHQPIIYKENCNSGMTSSVYYIDAAIRNEEKISFDYDSPNGPTQHVLSPYRTIIDKGVYYVIGCDEELGDITHFAIHKMHNTSPVEKPAKDYHNVKSAAKWHYDFQQYIDRYIR